MGEFDGLRRLRVKFKINALRPVSSAFFFDISSTMYGKTPIKERKGMLQEDVIDLRWIQSLGERFWIVSRLQTGKLQIIPEKTVALEKDVARYLDRLKCVFDTGDVDERCMRSTDETHFFTVDIGRAIGFVNDEEAVRGLYVLLRGHEIACENQR